MNRTLLPGHRPKIQKGIDLAAADAFEALPVYKIDTSPDRCVAELLPVLAASFNINISGLEEAQQRRLIKKAFLLNRYKGTAFAVREALTALFPTSTLIEHEDDPFMFSIRIEFGEEDKYDTDSHKALLKVLDGSKNVRSHLKTVDFSLPDGELDLVKQSDVSLEVKANTSIKTNHTTRYVKTSSAVFKI